MFSSSLELLGPPLPQNRKRKENTLRRTFPSIPGGQALLIPTAFGRKWLLTGVADWLPGPGQAEVNSRTGCQGTGGPCSQRQEESLGHVQYWPEMSPRSHPPDCLSTFFISPSANFHTIAPMFILKTKQQYSPPQLFATDKMRGSGSYQVSEVMSQGVTPFSGCLHLNRE